MVGNIPFSKHLYRYTINLALHSWDQMLPINFFIVRPFSYYQDAHLKMSKTELADPAQQKTVIEQIHAANLYHRDILDLIK